MKILYYGEEKLSVLKSEFNHTTYVIQWVVFYAKLWILTITLFTLSDPKTHVIQLLIKE